MQTQQMHAQEAANTKNDKSGVRSSSRINKMLVGSPYAIKNAEPRPTLREIVAQEQAGGKK
jgi:hypothetical protein